MGWSLFETVFGFVEIVVEVGAGCESLVVFVGSEVYA